MITVRDSSGSIDIVLTTVDHFTTAEDAARALWKSAFEASKSYGGEVSLVNNGTAVWWNNGPNQWADAYAVSEGADAREFACIAEDGDQIKFVDLD